MPSPHCNFPIVQWLAADRAPAHGCWLSAPSLCLLPPKHQTDLTVQGGWDGESPLGTNSRPDSWSSPPHLDKRLNMGDGSKVKENDGLKVKENYGSKESGSTWRLWPFFLLHLSSGLSGANKDDHQFILLQMLPILPTFPIGSLTTLLIAHLATLQLGDHLEFYVTLTGTLKIPIFKCLAGANI